MYASIRRYEVAPEDMERIVARVHQWFAPLLPLTEGFRSYYLARTGKDSFLTISVFDTAEQAEASVLLARNWVEENLAAVVPQPPEVDAGEVLVLVGR